MTLRVNIEIVPYGDERDTYPIGRLDISNTGMVRNEGFGHEICSYYIKKFRYNNETQQRLLDSPEWELVKEGEILEHDRRDGAEALVQKALELVGDT